MPSPSKSAKTGPMADVFSPFCPKPTPAGRDLPEGPFALVVQQEVLALVIGDVDVRISVAIEIRGSDAHGPALEFRDPRFAEASLNVPLQLLCINTFVSAG